MDSAVEPQMRPIVPKHSARRNHRLVEMRALLDKQESASREFLKEKGMVFCGVPTDEDEWMKRAVSIWPQFYPQIKNLEIVEAFMKTLGRQLPR